MFLIPRPSDVCTYSVRYKVFSIFIFNHLKQNGGRTISLRVPVFSHSLNLLSTLQEHYFKPKLKPRFDILTSEVFCSQNCSVPLILVWDRWAAEPNGCSSVRGVEYVGHRCSTAVLLSQESLTPSPSHLPYIDISPAETPASPLSSTSAPHVIIAHQCAAQLTIQATSSSTICQLRDPRPTRQLRKEYVTAVLY